MAFDTDSAPYVRDIAGFQPWVEEEKKVSLRSVPSVLLVDVKAKTREKIIIAGARMCEKVVHLKAHGGFGLHQLLHPGHSQDEEERKEEAADTMAAATEWRIRKEQEARDRTQWERASIRERGDAKTTTQHKALINNLQHKENSNLG